MIDQLYRILPTFFGKYFVDGQDRRLLDPVLGLYVMAAEDTLQRAADISRILDIDACPNVLREMYKTVRVGDPIREGRWRYALDDQSIIHIDALYSDVGFERPFDEPFWIGHDVFNERRFIEFEEPMPKGMTLWAKEAHVGVYPVIEFYGKLLGHAPMVKLHDGTVTDGAYRIDFDHVMAQLTRARQEIFALLNVRMRGTTQERLTDFLSAILGYPISMVDGTVMGTTHDSVTSYTKGVVTVQEIPAGTSLNPKLKDGGEIHKYCSLTKPPVLVYDFYADPARFTQTLLADGAEILTGLLKIKTEDGEQYAALFWDSELDWDNGLLFWDMGDHSLVEGLTAVTSPMYRLPVDATPGELVSDFTDFVDNRFGHTVPPSSIAEIFCGVTIIEVRDVTLGKAFIKEQFEKFLPMVKQSFTKFVVVFIDDTTHVPVTGISVDPGKLDLEIGADETPVEDISLDNDTLGLYTDDDQVAVDGASLDKGSLDLDFGG